MSDIEKRIKDIADAVGSLEGRMDAAEVARKDTNGFSNPAEYRKALAKWIKNGKRGERPSYTGPPMEENQGSENVVKTREYEGGGYVSPHAGRRGIFTRD